jgi:hypothetical protein
LGVQLSASALPGSEDRAEADDTTQDPALDGLRSDAAPPAPSSDDAGGAETETLPKRLLRPRNAAGAVATPPKAAPKKVFRRGGGRN